MTDAHELYGLPLDEFVPARDALVKTLRADGNRDRAKEIAGLRKPSVAAWAVNQLVRTQGRDVDGLFAAGDALQDAQSQLLKGRGDGSSLRDAVAREREAVDELAGKARGLLTSGGAELTPTMLERVSDTLHAAALDEEARAQVRDGCLIRELKHVGLGGFGTAGTSAPAPKASRGPAARERKERQQAERAHREQLKAARTAASDARRAAERSERELRSAESRRDDAADALHEAEEALVAARQAAARTSEAHDLAREEFEALQRSSDE